MPKEPHNAPGPYLLRTVRVGLTATAMIIAALAAIPFLPGSPVTETGLYWGVLGAAAAGGVLVALLPWAGLFERGHGMVALYLWSLGDILLVTGLLIPTGGGRSGVFWVYMMTTVFFAASYPQRVQAVLTAITAGAYLTVSAITASFPPPAELAIRLAVLACVAHMCSFLSRELMREVRGHRAAQADAEAHARVLGQIAESARHVNDLDPERANTAVLDALDALGYPSASICVLEEDGRWFRHARAKGFAAPPSHRLLPVAEDVVVSDVLRTGRTVVFQHGDQAARVVMRVHRVKGIIAAPVRIDGSVAAVLIGGTPVEGLVGEDHIEPFELLANLAGRAMSNATRFRSEQEAARRLAEVDAMKSDFLTTVSQELRTPLTTIAGVGELLAHRWETIDDATRLELLTQSNTNTAELRRIIVTMLDLSQIHAGTLTSAPQVVDLTALLRQAVADTGSLLADHQLSVVVPEDLQVIADPAMLARVVDSLLVNIARHTSPGTTATLSAGVHGGRVRVEVADDGPGIDRELREALGSMFLRGGALHARSRGLGLGIALSMEILRLHGSELEIESTVGVGTACGFQLAQAPDPGQPGWRNTRVSRQVA